MWRSKATGSSSRSHSSADPPVRTYLGLLLLAFHPPGSAALHPGWGLGLLAGRCRRESHQPEPPGRAVSRALVLASRLPAVLFSRRLAWRCGPPTQKPRRDPAKQWHADAHVPTPATNGDP